MNKSVIEKKEIDEFLNNSDLQMLSREDFDNALEVSNKIINMKISVTEFNKRVLEDTTNIKALFVIFETLKDESLQDVYVKIFDEISTSVNNDIIMMLDTKIVSSLSDETISLILFYEHPRRIN